MKIIEAMKKIKENKEKIADLQNKIGTYCAHLSYETPLYGAETSNKIREWTQSCHDLVLDNVKLLTRISKTNNQTSVSITIGENTISKSIAEWVWRRREYAQIDIGTWSKMTDRNLKEGMAQATTPGGEATKISIVRNYDPVLRDKKIAEYRSEPHLIDAALEVVNATTDLVD